MFQGERGLQRVLQSDGVSTVRRIMHREYRRRRINVHSAWVTSLTVDGRTLNRVKAAGVNRALKIGFLITLSGVVYEVLGTWDTARYWQDKFFEKAARR